MQTYQIMIDENKKETTQHGSFEFPLAIYTTQIRKNILGFIDWHWHEELQFCIVTRGVVHFNVNRDTITLSKGEGIFINKNQLHKAVSHVDHDSAYFCFDFHSNLISSFIGSVINTKYVHAYTHHAALSFCVLAPSVHWQKLILEKLLIVYELYHVSEKDFELDVFILLMEIWRTLVKHHFEKFTHDAVHTPDATNFIKVMDYIHHHYMEKIELSHLAEVLNLSKSSFCRKFKVHMNCTVFEYLINYRLSKAEELLLHTDKSIAEIAYQCGFGSTSYFIEKFKMKTQRSPLHYRKEMKHC